ncbi:hypothetical protein NNA36_06810 [Shimia sp. CNT1-13L.2]|uniref:hypothetical protein n=1 Tax=Shimia sp. CNT1-13L.2 TaxID=2959663 RepID=UPI0020CBFEA8|nr:hypothetical protein [Shimia sp. CNT1-13L.2]MCP9481671.1 hypothetical protein [Shimia sp. CNT1-13L.2]
MAKNRRSGMVQINLHNYDRNLMDSMAQASNETRPQIISRLLHREALERGLKPKKPDYPSAPVKK